jgi:hypothetical protein
MRSLFGLEGFGIQVILFYSNVGFGFMCIRCLRFYNDILFLPCIIRECGFTLQA